MSKKTEVIDILFDMVWPPGAPQPIRMPMTVTGLEVQNAIRQRNANHPEERKGLSSRNPANFLKDFIRKRSCNAYWPARLQANRITARQRYGQGLVFEFVPYRDGDGVPFPDRYDPVPGLRTFEIESISMPRAARVLGRTDEPWLTQVVVYQRIIHTHLAIVSPLNVLDLAHLQMSVKTQPEIDSLFVTTISLPDGREIRALLTMEAKQIGERILEDQVKEQVAKAFQITANLHGQDAIHAVLPMVVKVDSLNVPVAPNGMRAPVRGIYLCEFGLILRDAFMAQYAAQLHEMPLHKASSAFYTLRPHVKGITYDDAPPHVFIEEDEDEEE